MKKIGFSLNNNKKKDIHNNLAELTKIFNQTIPANASYAYLFEGTINIIKNKKLLI
jgi:hypothetical protein